MLTSIFITEIQLQYNSASKFAKCGRISRVLTVADLLMALTPERNYSEHGLLFGNQIKPIEMDTNASLTQKLHSKADKTSRTHNVQNIE